MVSVHLASAQLGEINRFLSQFYNVSSMDLVDDRKWEKSYSNPVELAEIVGAYIDNLEDFSFHMWITLDKNLFIHITEKNADDFIRYLYERFPY